MSQIIEIRRKMFTVQKEDYDFFQNKMGEVWKELGDLHKALADEKENRFEFEVGCIMAKFNEYRLIFDKKVKGVKECDHEYVTSQDGGYHHTYTAICHKCGHRP